MTVWRIWHVHNEITHCKPPPPTEASRRFLASYIESLLCIRQHPHADPVKGKYVLEYDHMLDRKLSISSQADKPRPPEGWAKPPNGWCKLNVDGAFFEADGTGGAGMVLRNQQGQVIFASCRYLTRCTCALEAELAACMEGVSLALEWSTAPFILETDCSTAADMISRAEVNRSPMASIVEETKRILGLGRDHRIVHVRREVNQVSHQLAHIGHSPRSPYCRMAAPCAA